MAWTELTRRRYERKSDGCSSDVTDREWAVIVPFLPDRNRSGRPRQVDLRWVRDAIQYLAARGCAWSLLPHDFPPISTLRYCFHLWRDDGLLSEINRKPVSLAGQAAGRERPPTAGD